MRYVHLVHTFHLCNTCQLLAFEIISVSKTEEVGKRSLVFINEFNVFILLIDRSSE